tara:strand:- start:161 stop:469 length:309 start_codon:yes stop_codon:yes gene_type:complete
MIAVNSISITLSTEDAKSKAVLDFSPISSISEGDTIYLSVKNESIDLETSTDTSLSKWLDWIVATYNMMPNITATLSRDSSNLVVLGSNSDNLNIELDLGEN